MRQRARRFTARHLTVIVFASCFLLFIVSNNRASPFNDGTAVVPTAVSVLHDGDLQLDEFASTRAISQHYAVSQADGHLVNYFPWSVALVAMPAVVLQDGLRFAGIGDGSDEVVRQASGDLARLQNLTAAFSASLAVAGLFVLVRRRVETTLGVHWALAITSAVALGTAVWSTAAITLQQHGSSLAASTWALVMIDRVLDQENARRSTDALIAGVLLMLAITFRPTNVLVLVAVLLVVGRQSRTLAARIGIGVGATAFPWLAITFSTYGSVLQPYGSANRLGFHDELGEALLGNLVSPGRGLFIFMPLAFLSLAGTATLLRHPDRTDPLQRVAMLVIPLHWIAVSMFAHWWGGHSFGPRFFTDVVVLLALLALPVLESAIQAFRRRTKPVLVTFVFVLCSLGVLVNAQGALVASTSCWSTEPVSVDRDHRRVWSWSNPLFARGIRDVLSNPVGARSGDCSRV